MEVARGLEEVWSRWRAWNLVDLRRPIWAGQCMFDELEPGEQGAQAMARRRSRAEYQTRRQAKEASEHSMQKKEIVSTLT